MNYRLLEMPGPSLRIVETFSRDGCLNHMADADLRGDSAEQIIETLQRMIDDLRANPDPIRKSDLAYNFDGRAF